MSWQVFTLIQVVVFALAAIGALSMRNRSLRLRNDQLLSLCADAHTELVNVTTRLSEADQVPSPEQLLEQRVRALIGDDLVLTVRRLVLENEIEPSPDFSGRLSEYLNGQVSSPADAPTAGDQSAAFETAGTDGALPPEEEFVRRWRSAREECQQLAMFLVAENPEILPAIRQLFEVVAPLDHAYGISLPPLALPHTAPADASEDPADSDPQDPAADVADDTLDQAALDALLEETEVGAQPGGTDESTASAPAGEGHDRSVAGADDRAGEDEPMPADAARTGTG